MDVHPLTEQEVFDAVARHLLTQARQSFLADGPTGCAYRGRDGLKCAIGAVIPDHVYDPTLEGLGVGDLPQDVLEASGLADVRMSLLDELQHIHDKSSVPLWAGDLRHVALKFGLSAAVIDELSPTTEGPPVSDDPDIEEPCDLTADERESAAQEERVMAKLARQMAAVTGTSPELMD